MAKEKELAFEQALTKLEGIVTSLESGKLSLEDSLKAFEEGVGLSKLCHTQLDQVEKKVERLLADGSKENFDNKSE